MADLVKQKQNKVEKKMQKYFDPKHPGSLSGVDKFHKSQKSLSKRVIKNFLKSKEAYTLHRPVRYRFPRNKNVVGSINQVWDSDVLFMVDL